MRVLRVLTRPNVGGPTRQAIALWHAHQQQGLACILAVGRCGPGEAAVDLASSGIPRLQLGDIVRLGKAACGLLEIPKLRRGPNPLLDAAAGRTLRTVIRSFTPHIVHTHTSKAGWLGRRAAWRARVPVVAHTYHGLVLRGYYAWPMAAALRRIETALARRTDLVFAVSPSCADELDELGVVRKPAVVMPPAVELGAFAAADRAAGRAELGVKDGRAALGFVGRLVPIKRPDLFGEVVGALPEADGFMFGDGPLRTQLTGAVGGRVQLFGATDALARYVAGLDVLVLCSEREGCPLSAVEAFAAGVPVVGFDVPGVRDVLGEWGAGVLVPRAEGAPGLARAVANLLADPPRAREVAACARAGLSQFAPAAVARRLAAAYAEVVG